MAAQKAQRAPKGGARRRPTAAEVAAATDGHVPDILGANLKLLLVGINPGLWSAAAEAHFARPGNRFWPAMHASGLTEYRFDVSAGYQDGDEQYLRQRGIGLTNIVARPTARAADLDPAELRTGLRRIRELLYDYRPTVVAFLGITSYRQALQQPKAQLGRQSHPLAPGLATQVWVLPNPSGLNAHALPAQLAKDFAAVGRAAGIALDSSAE